MVRRSVVETVFARDKRPLAPRYDHLELRRERLECVFEADLVISLDRRAVRQSSRALGQRVLYLVLRNDRPCDRRSEHVFVLVDCARPDGGEDIFAEKFFAKILHDGLLGASLVRLLHDSVEVFALAHIGDERNDIVAIVFIQPRNDDRGVETTGVCEDYFFCHYVSLLSRRLEYVRGLAGELS